MPRSHNLLSGVASAVGPFSRGRLWAAHGAYGGFSLASLFAASEQGVWYDPSDKANRDWRRNLLTYTEDFGNAAWSKLSGATVAANVATSPIGDSTANRITFTADQLSRIEQTVATNAVNHTHSLWVKSESGSQKIRISVATISSDFTVTESWTRIQLPQTASTSTAVQIRNGSDGAARSVLIWGAQLELGSAATDYQKITDVHTETRERFPNATLYQDSAGTQPAASAGDVVGRILDKSGNGNHATQATTASKPILARHPVGGRRNLLTYTEDFGNAAWLKTNATVTANATAAPDGSTTADAVFETTANAAHFVRQDNFFSAISGVSYTFTAYIKPNGRDFVFAEITASQFPAGVTAYFNVSAATVGTLGAAVNSASCVDVGGGFVRISLTATANSTGSSSDVLVWPAMADGVNSYAGDATKGIFLWGAQLETGSTATAYQKVVSQYNVTEAGKADLWYLAFDGFDDGMATGSINFTSTDEMTVIAGVRKLANTQGMLAESSVASTGNNGSFNLQAPQSATNRYFLYSRGDAVGQTFVTDAAFDAPITNVLSGLAKIATDTCQIRLDGVLLSTGLGDQGTGNFGTYPLYIGRRGGSSLPFNGHLYGLVVRGALTAGDTLTKSEAIVATKTGVTL